MFGYSKEAVRVKVKVCLKVQIKLLTLGTKDKKKIYVKSGVINFILDRMLMN